MELVIFVKFFFGVDIDIYEIFQNNGVNKKQTFSFIFRGIKSKRNYYYLKENFSTFYLTHVARTHNTRADGARSQSSI